MKQNVECERFENEAKQVEQLGREKSRGFWRRREHGDWDRLAAPLPH